MPVFQNLVFFDFPYPEIYVMGHFVLGYADFDLIIIRYETFSDCSSQIKFMA